VKKIAYAIAALLVGAPQVAHAQTSLKVLISADMEGIGGVISSMQASTSGREYEKFRRLMTQEVNAAVEGAYAAGATEVLVVDSHGNAQNLDVELLDPRARLTRGWPRALGMVHGVDSSFDAVVFIGFHAKEGDGPGVLAHTFTGAVDLDLNGEAVSEGSFAAAIAGHFGVPVVFVSGDQTITSDLRRQLGPLETVVVKEAIGFHAATSLHPEEARRRIAAGVERGVRQRADVSPYLMDGPVTLQLRWENPVMTEVVSLMQGAERVDGRTNRFTGADMIEVAEFFEVIHHIRPPS
jgi:D-amino peptidase